MDKLKTKELFKKMEDHSDRLAALFYNLQRKHKTTYLDKLDKQIMLKRWIEAKQFKEVSEKQNLKAFKFHQLNQKIKLKILIQRSRKILKKEKQTYKLIHTNLYKKYRLPVVLEGLRTQVKINKSMRTIHKNMRRNVLKAIR
jgi:hypothetical protein